MSSQTPGVASTSAASRTRKPQASDGFTPIGVDVGTRNLATVASADATLEDAVVVDGDRAQQLYSEFTKATHRLREREDHAENLGDVVWRYWRRFRHEFRAAADAVIEYAQRWPAPVVVLEDLAYQRRPLVACRHGRVPASAWFPAAVQAVVADRVVEAGLPTTYVSALNTTKQCHDCGELATKERETIVCSTADCPVDEVCRDRSAALTIATRAVDETRG